MATEAAIRLQALRFCLNRTHDIVHSDVARSRDGDNEEPDIALVNCQAAPQPVDLRKVRPRQHHYLHRHIAVALDRQLMLLLQRW